MKTKKFPKLRFGEIIEQEMFKSPYDLLKLEIIDWNRYYPCKNLGDAVYILSSFLEKKATYTVIKCDLRLAPERSDFPGWHHIGTKHVPIARMYWNWFHNVHADGTLLFSDAPDFGGNIKFSDGLNPCFVGDIGKVSVNAFVEGLRYLIDPGDFWLSIVNEEIQVMIEPHTNMLDVVQKSVRDRLPKLEYAS